MIYERRKKKDRVVVAVNRGEAMKFTLRGKWNDILTGKKFEGIITLDKDSAIVLERM